MSKEIITKERLFGTDGIRGTPGTYPLTDEMIKKIGLGIAAFILDRRSSKKTARPSPAVVIGKDTRLSGSHIEKTITDAIRSCGVNVLCAGIITTPGLSFLTGTCKADIGIMISASHNKATDNGIKFFNSFGHKFSTQEESVLEEFIFNSLTHDAGPINTRRHGTIKIIKNAQSRYVSFLVSTMQGLDLKGMRIALDCAWGAAAPFAKKVFTRLGAKVCAIHDKPSGHTINEGGAIAPDLLRKLTVDKKCDIGVAVDGDGDRGILVDEKGHALDGDHTMAIIAKYLLNKKNLHQNTIVATVMSNVGLKICIEENGGKMIITDVGDKHVLEALLKNKLALGGEQSGHIIFLDYLSTPDGLLTALQILKVMKDCSAKLSGLAQCMTKYPQILVNVKVKERKPFESMKLVSQHLKTCSERLKNNGRILLRYSGTELLARVMVEGKDKNVISEIADSLAARIKEEIGA